MSVCHPMATRFVTIIAALFLLTGCMAPKAEIRPVGTSLAGAQMAAEREDADYASAKVAIGRRDYAAALDWLQSARARNPSDVRVLNAFGVVYDKLGRFDLSDRYYQQALAIDHTSEVVLHNRAYSQSLQGRTVASPAPVEMAVSQPAPSVITVIAETRPAQLVTTEIAFSNLVPSVIMDSAKATPVSPPTTAIAQIRPALSAFALPSGWPTPAVAAPRPNHALLVVNATGRPHGGQAIIKLLVGRKWAMSRRGVRPAPQASATTIHYSPGYRAQALGLARTLPRRAQLIEDDSDGEGVQLVLGTDSMSWTRHALSRS